MAILKYCALPILTVFSTNSNPYIGILKMYRCSAIIWVQYLSRYSLTEEEIHAKCVLEMFPNKLDVIFHIFARCNDSVTWLLIGWYLAGCLKYKLFTKIWQRNRPQNALRTFLSSRKSLKTNWKRKSLNFGDYMERNYGQSQSRLDISGALSGKHLFSLKYKLRHFLNIFVSEKNNIQLEISTFLSE